MNLLIVDDDTVEIQVISSIIKKEHLGIDRIFYAYRAAQAKKILEDEKIEIIICDIEMPGENGLEFLDYLQEIGHGASKIILTAYEEFEYATWAMRAEAMDYLLKPVEDEQLNKVLEKAVRIQTENRLKRQKLNEWEKQKFINREIFFEEIVNGIIEESGRVLQKEADLRKIGMSVNTVYLPVLFCLKKWPAFFEDYDQKLRYFIMKNIAYELFEELSEEVICLPIHHRGIGVLFCGEIDFNMIYKVSMEYMNRFHSYYGEYLCGYLGEKTDISGLKSEVQKLIQIEKNNLIHENKLIGKLEKEQEVLFEREIFRHLMISGKAKKAAGLIKNYLDIQKKNGCLDGRMLEKLQQQIIQEVYLVLYDAQTIVNEIFNDSKYQELRKKSLLTIEDFNRWLDWLLNETTAHMSEERDKNSPVGKAKRFIHENLDKEMKCKDVADAVYMDSDYLSKLFKKEAGMSLLEYIHKERIKLASKLLLITNQSVSDIAMQTGYTNASHFTTAFKKETGVSPLEYRKQKENNQNVNCLFQ